MKHISTTADLTYISLFAIIIAICSWISIPTIVPFTLQTFGIFCALDFLGGKKGTLAIIVYTLLGAVGIPVFSNFTGGVGILFGVTGGYILGFIFSGFIYWTITAILGTRQHIRLVAMSLGLVTCYAFGTIWFMYVYGKHTGPIGVTTALMSCVLPFVIPDMIKIACAFILSKRLKTMVGNSYTF